MKSLKSEYKLLIFLGGIFTVVLVAVLIKYNVFDEKMDELRSKQYIKCTQEKKEKGLEYTSYYCTITDDLNTTYVISYPKIEMKTRDIDKINNVLSKEYNTLVNKINFIKGNDKFYLKDAYSLKYEIHNYGDIVSILVIDKSTVENDDKTYKSSLNYKVYNLDKNTGKLINNNQMKKKCGITLDLSSKIRMVVIKMYALDYGYDYIGKLSYLRDETIDRSVENVTYNNMTNVYIDDDGNTKFILYLYNPDYKRDIPYYFTIDRNQKITYEIKEK